MARRIDFYTAAYCVACKLAKPTVQAIAEAQGAEFNEIDNQNNEHVPAGVVFLPTIDVENDAGTITRFEGLAMIENAGTIENALGVPEPTVLGRFFPYMNDYFTNIEIEGNQEAPYVNAGILPTSKKTNKNKIIVVVLVVSVLFILAYQKMKK